MKKSLYIFILLLLNALSSYSDNYRGMEIRDSLYKECSKIKSYSNKCDFLNNAFEDFVDKDWSIVLPQLSLGYALKSKNVDKQFDSYYNFIKYYQYRTDIKNIEKYFKNLRQLSYKYKRFDDYFNIWSFIIENYLVYDETEKAFFENKKMIKEAKLLKFSKGILYSYFSFGNYYSYIGNFDKSLYYYSLVSNRPDSNDNARINIHDRIANVYLLKKDYKRSVNEIEKEQKLIYKSLKNKKNKDRSSYYSLLVGTELFLCDIYYETKDIDSFKIHLFKAKSRFNKNSFLPYSIHYHKMWGKYYALTKNWEKSEEEFNIALSYLSEDQKNDIDEILKDKADMLFDSGNYEKSYEIYKYYLRNVDQLTKEILGKNEKVNNENSQINNVLLKSNKLRSKFYLILIIIIVAIIVIISIIVYRIYIVRLKLRKSKKELEKEYQKIQKENRDKEHFLKNIDFDIRTPLNAIVGLSNVLCEEKELTEDEKATYSRVIKENSDLLLRLIFNILDYSRLEAGMMKFTIETCDAVRLCRDSAMLIEIRKHKKQMINVNCEIKSVMISTDSSFFIKVISSFFEPIDTIEMKRNIECNISKDENYVLINITGTPLLRVYKKIQEYKLQNKINRQFTQTFKGEYIIDDNEKNPSVTIKYPLKK